jgi:hypothetical protein
MEGFTFLPETADPNVNPLEDGMVFSLDCAMLDCSSDPDAPVLQRATITMNTKVKVVTLNPDTGEAELVQVKLNPYLGFTPLTWDEENQQCNPLIEARRVEDGVVASESRRKFYMPSWTPFRRMRTYVETNNSSLEVCGPLTDGECFCPNLREFHREEPVCGDGQITGPEECDTRSARPNRGCDRNEVCNTVEDQRRGRGKACTCRDKRPPPPPPPEEVCGDGQITGREPCDTRSDRPRGGCQEGHHCVEQANRCSCQRDAPPQLSECATGTGGRRASRLEERVQEKVLGHGHTIRNTHLGAPGSTRVGFSAIATISGDGDVTFRPPVARVTCLGPCSKTRRISGQALLGITGALGLHGKTVDAPQDRNACRWVISFPINAGQ